MNLANFLGENHKLPDVRLNVDNNQVKGTFVRSATNCDLSGGILKRRTGMTRVTSGARCSAFWSDGNDAYYLKGADLYHVSPDLVETLVTGPRGLEMSYCVTPRGIVCGSNEGLWLLSGATAKTFAIDPEAPDTRDGAELPEAGSTESWLKNLRKMPGGRIVRHHLGRLLTANGKFVFYSEPHALGYTQPDTNYIPFPHDVTLLEPCAGGGVYVSDGDKTWWLAGDIAQAAMVEVLPYGAVFQQGIQDDDGNVYWMGRQGLVVGGRDGQVKALQSDAIDAGAGSATFSASLYREQNGERQIITTVFDAAQGNAVASDYTQAEQFRSKL